MRAVKLVACRAPIIVPCAVLLFIAHAASAAQDAQSAVPDPAGLLDRLETLEKRSLELEAENLRLRTDLAALRRALVRQEHAMTDIAGADRGAKVKPVDAVAELERIQRVGLGGQYRINGYAVDDDVGGVSRAAARLRLRQNLDFAFDERLSTHLQFELGHTTDNTTTTSESSRNTDIDVRHAVLAYDFAAGVRVEAGILPLSDRFLDTQYSSDWDYNPLALSVDIPLAAGRLRLVAANLDEGQETVADDFLHLGADYRFDVGKAWFNTGAQILNVAAPDGRQREHAMAGVSGRLPLDSDITLSAFVAGSFTDRALLAGARRGSGFALGLRLDGPGGWEILASHASGRRDGSGFLPVMALARTYGYWGLTGLLTVQGPTDTGFDGDAVNISNNGFGMTSVQARYRADLAEDRWLTLAAGYFGNSRTPRSRSDFLGIDLLTMLSWRLTDILVLDTGVAYARLDDGVSGFGNGVVGGAVFNGPAGVERDKIAGFTRLQVEFR